MCGESIVCEHTKMSNVNGLILARAPLPLRAICGPDLWFLNQTRGAIIHNHQLFNNGTRTIRVARRL